MISPLRWMPRPGAGPRTQAPARGSCYGLSRLENRPSTASTSSIVRVVVPPSSALPERSRDLDATDIHHERARAVLLERIDQRLGASVLTLAEALVLPARQNRLDEAARALDELTVEPIEVGSDAAPFLALLRTETSLRMPDCCVLHAASRTRSDTILTFDERLARVARARGLIVPG
jgi:predicted nucleic acid-binding protein